MSERYTKSLFSLLPPGLFSFEYSVNVRKFLRAIAEELALAENYIKGIFDNLFPKNASENFLLKWGTLTRQEAATLESLRTLVLRQLAKSGGATRQSFQSHLKSLGLPAQADRVIPTLEPFSCQSNCDDYIWGAESAHTFGLRLPFDPQLFNCQSKCDAHLIENQREDVLQYLRGSAPAHARLIFFYEVNNA